MVSAPRSLLWTRQDNRFILADDIALVHVLYALDNGRFMASWQVHIHPNGWLPWQVASANLKHFLFALS